jgi:hypothetical protein
MLQFFITTFDLSVREIPVPEPRPIILYPAQSNVMLLASIDILPSQSDVRVVSEDMGLGQATADAKPMKSAKKNTDEINDKTKFLLPFTLDMTNHLVIS